MAGKIIKYIFLALLILVIGALVFRIMLSNDKSTFSKFEITDTSRAAYEENGNLTVSTLALKDKISGAGYFCAYSMYYVEETKELQVTVRYNKSAIGYTGVETEEDFKFLLLNKKTPMEIYGSSVDISKEDNLFKRYDGKYMEPDSVERDTKYGLYTFKKLIFKDIILSEDAFQSDEFSIVMLPTDMTPPSPDDDALTRVEAYEMIFDSQIIHFADQPLDNYSLSKKDIAALKGE